MAFDIFVLCLFFIVGLLLGFIDIIMALKLSLRKREFANSCEHCNNKYKWYELIPLVSYFINKGKCPYCQKNKSIWYVILEILSGVSYSLSYIFYGFSYELIVMIILTNLLILIYVSDFKYLIILDEPLLLFSVIILICKYMFFGFETFLISICSGLLIFIFMMVVRFIGNKLFKQESIGGGDIKLSMFFGFTLGIKLSIISLILGSFLAFPYAIYSSLKNINKEIPFGPFLVTGLFLVFILMDPIRSFFRIIF